MNTGALPTNRVKLVVSSLKPSLVTLTLYVKFPSTVGVPERTPVAGSKAIPAGRAPEEML